MEKFTASNGLRVECSGDIIRVFNDALDAVNVLVDYDHLDASDTAALREFFLHERDQELGRWRWPENPDYVVSLSEGGESVWVLNERENGMISFTREMSTPVGEEEAGYSGAAWAYFAAHPEPKPWHEAKPGEVWELTTRGVDGRWNPTAFYVGDRESGAHTIEAAFFPVESDYSVSHLGIRAAAITAGRRIWPEVSDD